jgi:hypothetical protein
LSERSVRSSECSVRPSKQPAIAVGFPISMAGIRPALRRSGPTQRPRRPARAGAGRLRWNL